MIYSTSTTLRMVSVCPLLLHHGAAIFFFKPLHAINAFTNAYGHSDALVGTQDFKKYRWATGFNS